MTDLVFVGDGCHDHSDSSGYHQLCSLFLTAGCLSGRRLEQGELSWHRRPSRVGGSDRKLFHVLYGDCSGRRLPELLRARFPEATVVCTAHQPVSRLVEDEQGSAALRQGDAVFAVSATQAEQLADLLPTPVHHLAHGVWSEAFRPKGGTGPWNRVLLVGNYLRDWQTATEVVDRLGRAGVDCVLVGSNVSSEVLAGHPFVERCPRIPERALAELYQGSAAMLLPVLDATASNALLEAMAAGCPVISTRSTPLVDEYLPDDGDCFKAGDYDGAADRLLRYVGNRPLRAARSATLIRRAADFDWARLKRRYATAYAAVAQAAYASTI